MSRKIIILSDGIHSILKEMKGKKSFNVYIAELLGITIYPGNRGARSPVVIEGVEYPSIMEASKQLGVYYQTILKRLKNPNFEQWQYKGENETIRKTARCNDV